MCPMSMFRNPRSPEWLFLPTIVAALAAGIIVTGSGLNSLNETSAPGRLAATSSEEESLESAFAYVGLNTSGLPPGTIWSFSAQGMDGASSSGRISSSNWDWSSPTNFTWSFQVSSVVVRNSTGNTTLYPSPASGQFTSGGPDSWTIVQVHFSTTPPSNSGGADWVNLVYVIGVVAAGAVFAAAAYVLILGWKRRLPPRTQGGT
jgi:hypothetical protein